MTKRLSFTFVIGGLLLAGCAGTNSENTGVYETPTVDYVERLDVYNAPQKDSFLSQLAMNYRSYAIYNARTSGYPDVGELFAQKAVVAFSGDRPFPETLDNWKVKSENQGFEIYNAYNKLMEVLKSDAIYAQPQLVAESQAKYDCWISAAASGQQATAQECANRFVATMQAIEDCMAMTPVAVAQTPAPAPQKVVRQTKQPVQEQYYPETTGLMAMSGTTRARDGLVIVNNVNIPSNLVQVVPVPAAPTVAAASAQPLVFNQNIYGVNGAGNNNSGEWVEEYEEYVEEPETDKSCNEVKEGSKTVVVCDKDDKEYVSREEFINMMMAMRSDLLAINERLSKMEERPVPSNEKTIIKVQQIPLEPKQHVMEEIFEIRFDFDKATIKPEYEDLIRKLATTTQENKNIKVSVVGHTDTSGSKDYNYALGGRRAEAVQKMLIQYGIPSSQIIAVSAGEEDLKVPTPNNTPNADNRRVRVVKEVHYQEPAPAVAPIAVEEYTEEDDEECEDCDEL